jgi:hypothetical protein
MASILVVVGNAGTPTSGDSYLEGVLQGLGHTVTYVSDETAEDVTGFDGIVVTDSCSSVTLGAKYDTAAIPLVSHEAQHWDDIRMITAASVTEISTTTITYEDDTHAIANGPYGAHTGTDTILSGSALIARSTSVASGVTQIASTGGATNIVCGAAESGATLTSGTAPARRVFMWPKEAAAVLLTADGENPLKNAYVWAFGVGSQVLYPDADVDTGDWATTPLWSKVEEETADGTVISATAS